ncbi:hypothetical protein [Seohaeicola zhoushanensis]|uniref:Uncharacterized protein n=1 Tax=Seohaeicola zhoushanensis TaxID=1569283 RepID=A0A8J3H1C9_9RHOB|nr:hypothetical protein [Seohaeicola zhoushanensis]GHF64009.1 hypothetical protein GCM10017056_38990 [Seohaeicola zhoushanensis]
MIGRLLRLTPFAASLGLTLWALAQSPFAEPLVQATAVQAERALNRALTARVNPAWLETEMAAALEAGDLDRVETLELVAGDVGLALPEAERVAALKAERSGWLAQAGTCGLCMADIAACPSVSHMMACGMPFELTPLGDANALRRAGMAMLEGEEVDRLEVTLAVVGLGATAAILVSGGTSTTVKAGATVLRVGRRLGTVTPEFLRLLTRLADVDLKPALLLPYARGAARLDEVVDTAKLARIEGVAGDLARVAGNTSVGDGVLLLRHVDSAEDAARLAKVSEVAGPRTRGLFEVLGKNRVFRALVRLSDLALTAALLIWATALQALLALAGWLGGRAFRLAVRRL